MAEKQSQDPNAPIKWYTCNLCKQKGTAFGQGGSKVMLRCSRCKIARYCGVKCQEKDWETHEKSCADSAAGNLTTLDRSTLFYSRRLPGEAEGKAAGGDLLTDKPQ
eukprot:gb/GEZN01017058.1/.p2 GENE.gb/GEZN01017058.1/~~gb/GEZN01017058.1/.p2  ORF type:complete len:106 (-),score=14.23 gb/GEZN01017058.1/:461-778(-)